MEKEIKKKKKREIYIIQRLLWVTQMVESACNMEDLGSEAELGTLTATVLAGMHVHVAVAWC